MSENISKGIESGKVSIKILTTNTVSITLLTEDKFKGKVIQPGALANMAVGEHGLSMSIKIKDEGETHVFLLDTGGLSQAIVKNSKNLGFKFSDVEKLIISHGHFDHWGGLSAVIPLLNEGTEIILNPNCFNQNYIAITKTREVIPAEELGENLKQLEKEGKFMMNRKLPILNKKMVIDLIKQHNLKLTESNYPIKLYNGITTSGEIELSDETEITKGFYIQKSRKDFEKHNFRDETSVYINIKDKGLVVLTGCGHCGIMNTIEHAKKLTGIDDIFAVIGGFHEEWNPIDLIEKKVKYFEEINPKIICGMHCTGFEFNKLMSTHPAHTLGVTGTTFRL